MTFELPKGIVNPFSEEFLATWEIWKAYKWENQKFKYKGVISEQAALKQLCELSDGEEEKAVKIILQSIRRQWLGFWPLHETSTSHERRKKQSATGDSKNGNGTLRERVQAAVGKRYGSGGSDGGSKDTSGV